MKKQRGITLIALIITIIVLLILAGVAISTLTGNDSIINNAGTAVDKYNEKAVAEEAVLNTLEKKLIEFSNGGGTGTDTPDEPQTPTPPSVDTNGLATAPYTIQPDATNPNLQIVIPTGFAPAVLAGGNAPGQNGSVASIMPANQWSSITVEQINKGIVVVDHAITYNNGQSTGTVPDFNEYVWVPITGSGENTFARKAWTTPYGYDSNGDWVDGTGVTQTLKNTSTENAYWEEIPTEMETSINNNKGFYISRYEASNNGSNVAQSKRGQAPWGDVTQTTAITASANNTTANTHLMYGAEWDSTLKWLIGNATISSSTAEQTKRMEIADIQTNSSSWGNYADSTGDAATNIGDIQNTGVSEYLKANNIYDLAGNIGEWTQEKYSTGSRRVHRGGFYNHFAGGYPAAYRDFTDESGASDGRRFPFQLLLVALNSGSDAQGK